MKQIVCDRCNNPIHRRDVRYTVEVNRWHDQGIDPDNPVDTTSRDICVPCYREIVQPLMAVLATAQEVR